MRLKHLVFVVLLISLLGCSNEQDEALTTDQTIQLKPDLEYVIYPKPLPDRAEPEEITGGINLLVIKEEGEWISFKYEGGEGYIPKWYASTEAKQIQAIASETKVLKQDYKGSLYPNGSQIVDLKQGKLLKPLKEWNGWYEVGILTLHRPAVQFAWVPADELVSVQEMRPVEGYLRTGTEVYLEEEFEKIPLSKAASIPYEMIASIISEQDDYLRLETHNGWKAWTARENLVYNKSSGIPKELPSALVNDERIVFVDESSTYNNSELTELNAEIEKIFSDNEKRFVSGDICFLDNDNIIFSVYNGHSNEIPEKGHDIYKYNLETKKLELLCQEFMIYYDSTVNIKDARNFSILRDGSYLLIEDDNVKTKRYLRSEAKEAFQYPNDVIYNESNDKILIRENDLITKTNRAFVTANDFTSPIKLPFNNIYRVQWADNDNVLIAYKDSNYNSYLVKYNLKNKSKVPISMPDNYWFIDPVITDNGIIKFLYLNEPINKTPWGFYDTTTGEINYLFFECPVGVSPVRNGRIAGYIPSFYEDLNQNNQLFIYNNTTKKISLRDRSIDRPQNVAVSPDETRIIFTITAEGKSKFILNEPTSSVRKETYRDVHHIFEIDIKTGVRSELGAIQDLQYRYFNLSPNRKWMSMIKITSSVGDGEEGIPFLYQLSDGKLMSLEEKVKKWDYEAKWFSDSSRIMFGRETVYNLHDREVTDCQIPENMIPLSREPSPDGNKIAVFAYEQEEQTGRQQGPLILYFLDSQNMKVIKTIETSLGTLEGKLGNPEPIRFTWMQDSQGLIVESWVAEEYWESSLWKINLTDGSVTKFSELGQYPLVSPDGQKVVYLTQEYTNEEPNLNPNTILKVVSPEDDLLSTFDMAQYGVYAFAGQMLWDSSSDLIVATAYFYEDAIQTKYLLCWDTSVRSIKKILVDHSTRLLYSQDGKAIFVDGSIY
ncbi:MAG: hypothetical protein APF84_04245 [Gracilibacter sp. BRH_c7a]|nr:MAG: hypothetical protein APF84_04245 [Gracilibacter sp. BRH_c7a]